jgi:hypothetical protein
MAGWFAVLAVLASSRSVPAVTITTNANICDGEWTQIEALPQFAERLSRWQALAPKCAKSGLYEARLATLQTLLGRYDEDKETARAGLALDTPYKKELLSTMAGVALNQGQLADAQSNTGRSSRRIPITTMGIAGSAPSC